MTTDALDSVQKDSPSAGVQNANNGEVHRSVKGPTYWSLIPFISTPVGLYHVMSGAISLAKNICQITLFVFSGQPCDKVDTPHLSKERKISWIREENKKGLSEAIRTIAQGILEMVPVIGNIAIYVSKWRAEVFLERKRDELLKKLLQKDEQYQERETGIKNREQELQQQEKALLVEAEVQSQKKYQEYLKQLQTREEQCQKNETTIKTRETQLTAAERNFHTKVESEANSKFQEFKQTLNKRERNIAAREKAVQDTEATIDSRVQQRTHHLTTQLNAKNSSSQTHKAMIGQLQNQVCFFRQIIAGCPRCRSRLH
jgi:hypothetical protein